jgi:nucleotidyltransferase/DNA polymerase involved in DNA repair
MERFLALWVEALAHETPDGAASREYLALLDALTALCPFTEPVRWGWFILPIRAPSRFLGGETVVLDAARTLVHDVTGREVALGVADGLFCAEQAARRGVVLAPGATEGFRRSLPLEALGRRDLATTGHRLGVHTVGDFADLARARVAERFDRGVLVLHQVARGELAELPGQRDGRLAARVRELRGDVVVGDEQRGFFGSRGAGDERAAAAVQRVRHRLGSGGVMVATLRGGRTPQDRAALVPWGAPTPTSHDDAPWPGRLRAPAPVITLAHPVGVGLRDVTGAPVRVESRGLLSGAPDTVVWSARTSRTVTWYAGPWPTVERWWTVARRRAHVQVVLVTGEALLLAAESRRWWLVGIYD